MTSGKSRYGPIFSLIVPVLAVLVTWLTGFWPTGYNEYGFPLPWRTTYFCAGCPPIPIPYSPYGMINWLNFALDVLSYAAIGYGLLLGCLRYQA